MESTRKASSACECTKRNINYIADSDHYLLSMPMVLFQKLVNVARALEDTREDTWNVYKTKGLQLVAVTHCFCGGEVGIRTLGTLPYT